MGMGMRMAQKWVSLRSRLFVNFLGVSQKVKLSWTFRGINVSVREPGLMSLDSVHYSTVHKSMLRYSTLHYITPQHTKVH